MGLFGLRRLIALAALFVSAAAPAAVVSVSASSSHVTVGSSFTLNFLVSGLHSGGVGSLAGFDLDLGYDSGVLQFNGGNFIDPASGLNQLDLPELGSLGFVGAATASGGLVDAFGLSGNSVGVLDADQADNFRFLQMSFTALAVSAGTELALQLADPLLVFLDGNGTAINMNLGLSAVRVVVDAQGGGGGTVNEPGALALALAGLGMAGVARRRARQLAALSLSALLALPALAQSPATPIEATVLEVAGARAKVQTDDGRQFWVSVGPELKPEHAGQRLRGQAQARGDSVKVTAATFTAK